MNLPDILTAVAAQFRTIDGIEVFYPAPSTIENFPSLILYSGSPDTALYVSHEAGQVVWTGRFYAHVLTARLGDVGAEIANIDALIFALVDAFSILPSGNRRQLPGLTGPVDRVEITEVHPNVGMEYAGQNYVGAQLYLDFKFRRRPTS